MSELPDPGSTEFAEIPNPVAAETREREQPSAEVEEARQALKKEEWEKYLKSMDMTELDFAKYAKYKDAVANEVRELRVTLESLEANDTERVWTKNQTTGDLDDTRLIDGLTGSALFLSDARSRTPTRRSTNLYRSACTFSTICPCPCLGTHPTAVWSGLSSALSWSWKLSRALITSTLSKCRGTAGTRTTWC